MTFKTLLLAVAATAGLCAPAQATVYNVTVTGTLGGAYDNAGIFGPAKTWLNGTAFTAKYRIDDGLPGIVFVKNTASELFYVGGFANNPVLGWLTVNGITRQVQPLSGMVYAGNDYGVTPADRLGFDARSDDFDGGVYYDDWISFSVTDTTKNLLAAPVLPTSLTYTVPGVLTFAGNFRFQNSRAGYLASGDLVATKLEIAAELPPPVPEPASWAMMIGGLGLVGAAMRRRATSVRFA